MIMSTKRPFAFRMIAIVLASMLLISGFGGVSAETKDTAKATDPIAQTLQQSFIWHPAHQGTVVFRKQFDVQTTITKADLHLFADARYALYLNGEYVLTGPSRFDPKGPEYDSLDVQKYLHAGTNAIAVVVYSNLSTGMVMRHQGGLSMMIDGSGFNVVTDDTWICSSDTRFMQAVSHWEGVADRIDETKEQGDCLSPAFEPEIKESVSGIKNLALFKTVTASSSVEGNGWGAQNAVDGIKDSIDNVQQGWSSASNEYVNHAEFITVDLGENQDVGYVYLLPRTDRAGGFPKNFTIEVSQDNQKWTTVVEKENYPQPAAGQAQGFAFDQQNIRYVKINGTVLGSDPKDGNRYRMQFLEIEIYKEPIEIISTENLARGKTVDASTSIEWSGWGKQKAVDGIKISIPDQQQGWSSHDPAVNYQNHTEWVSVDLGERKTVSYVELLGRTDRAAGFPEDFTIQVSDDNERWTTVVAKEGYKHPAAGEARGFDFETVQARYIKIEGTKLTKDPLDDNQYRMQFLEIEVYSVPKEVAPENRNYALDHTVTTSSLIVGNGTWAPKNLTDGNPDLGWSSAADEYNNHTEWATIDLGLARDVGCVTLYPRQDMIGASFPVAFQIRVSDDNQNWTPIVTKTDYPNPGGAAQTFEFQPVKARYVQVYATSLRQNSNDGNRYRLQLGEFEIYKEKPQPGDIVIKKSSWYQAVAVDGNNWGTLQARSIPLLQETDIPYKEVRANGLTQTLPATMGNFSVTLDKDYLVQVELDVEVLTNATTIKIWDHSYKLTAGRQIIRNFDSFGTNGNKVDINISDNVIIHGIRIINRIYPFEIVSSFNSNDEYLNRLYQMCMHTLTQVSEDGYQDCPWERAEWMGDSGTLQYPLTRVALAGPDETYSDPRLIKKMIRDIAMSQQEDGRLKAHHPSDRWDIHGYIEDYSCMWVESLRLYYENTGDDAFVREMWPMLQGQLDLFEAMIQPSGLVKGREFIIFQNPLAYQTVEGATLNACIYKAYRDAAYMAGEISDDTLESKYNTLADGIYTAFNNILWTGTTYNGSTTTGPTYHAAYMALNRGIVPKERQAIVRQYLLDNIIAASNESFTYTHVFIFDELYKMNTPEADQKVLDLIRSRFKTMYDSGYDGFTLAEGFNGQRPFHNFGSVPAIALSAHVLGVQVDGPVWNRSIIIQPRLGDLEWASGNVCTEFGVVPVSWKKLEGGKLQYEFTVPEGVTARVYLDSRDQYRIFTAGTYSGVASGAVAEITDENGLPKTSAETNGLFYINVTTSNAIESIKIINENGLSIGKKSTAVTVNEDGTKTWKIGILVSTAGAGRELTILAAGQDGTFNETGLSVKLDITAVSPAVLSAVPKNNTAQKDEAFEITVVTSKTIDKVKLTNELGASIGIISKTYVIDGNDKIWTLTAKIGTAGNRVITVWGAPKDGEYLTQTKDFMIAITKPSV